MTAPPPRWSPAVVALHGINAALILALLALGWVMTRAVFGAAATFDLSQRHKALGFVALARTAARLAARAAAHRPPLPAARWERRLAAVVQAALYALTIGAIVSGWLVVSASPLPVPTRFFGLFEIPNLAGADPSLFAAARAAHALTAYAIAGFVALHVAGALKHHFIDRDDVLARMGPRRRIGSRSDGRRAGPP